MVFAIIGLALGLCFVIFIHEFGHFLVAKLLGIRVTQFALGFGPSLLTFRQGLGVRWGSTEEEMERRQDAGETGPFSDTEYRLNAIPLGGYVKMVGQEDLDPTATSDDPAAYNNKPVWVRCAVISAGVIMNAISAVVFFVAAFYSGVALPPAQVGSVVAGSPAAKATPEKGETEQPGLRPGDKIVRVNGDRAKNFKDIQIASALAGDGEPVRLVVKRPAFGGEPAKKLHFSLEPKEREGSRGLKMIGVKPPRSRSIPSADELKKDGLLSILEPVLHSYGLEPGMTLVAVDGEPVEGYWAYELRLKRSGGETLTLTFEGKAGKRTTVEVAPLPELARVESVANQGVRHLLGLVPLPEITAVDPDGPAGGKLQRGDLLVSVEGADHPSTRQTMQAIEDAAEEELTLRVWRDGEEKEVTVTPQRTKAGGRIQVFLRRALDTPFVAQVLPGSPFAGFRWPPMTRVRKLGEKAVSSYRDIRRAVVRPEPKKVKTEVTYELPLPRAEKESGTVVIPEQRLRSVAELGWTDPFQQVPLFGQKRVKQQAEGPVDAAEMGMEETWKFMVITYMTIARLFEGEVEVKHLRGPVGIATAGTRFAKRGWEYLLFFLGLLSINLAVLNFLPLPILDGGHFVMLMIEKLRGKPVPAAIQSAITVVGLVLLLSLFAVVTFHDIRRLIGPWMGL